MKKAAKITVILLVATLLTGMLAGCAKQETGGVDSPVVRRQLETVKPNEDDGAIYRGTEEFVRAMVADDRQKVLSLLTADHRNSWRDESFLLSPDAKAQFEEITMENLNYTVVKYINNEETQFVDNGFIFAVYDVVMKKGGKEVSRAKMQENLVFRQENGQWLIAADERGFLVKEN